MFSSDGASTSSQSAIDLSGLYDKDNILLLTNSSKFQNTTLVLGASYIPAVTSVAHGAKDYFSGYVFRGDRRPAEIVLKEGFLLQHPFVSENQLPRMAGAVRGITWSEGISTSICAQAAAQYRNLGHDNLAVGYVYLIDAVHLSGFAIPSPCPDHPLARRFPVLVPLYEVNFMHGIPNTSIVGAVWPKALDDEHSQPWPDNPGKLSLAVNPEYEGGMEGAKAVVKRFNKSW